MQLGDTSVSAIYLRNSNDDVWEMNSDGTCGDWVGVAVLPWGIQAHEQPPVKPEVGEPGLCANRFWSCPADGRVYLWAYTPLGATSVSEIYLRNSNDDVWEMNSDGTCGDWAGQGMVWGD
jgi:hypothetical protein